MAIVKDTGHGIDLFVIYGEALTVSGSSRRTSITPLDSLPSNVVDCVGVKVEAIPK